MNENKLYLAGYTPDGKLEVFNLPDVSRIIAPENEIEVGYVDPVKVVLSSVRVATDEEMYRYENEVNDERTAP